MDKWLTAERAGKMARALVLLQTLVLGVFIAGTHGWITKGVGPTTTDFVAFYAGGALANQGRPADAYNHAQHFAAEEAATQKGIDGHYYFFYPPNFLLLCAPLARLPYMAAFLVFELATFLLWLTLATRIAGGGRLAVTSLLSVSSLYWTLGLGQNAFLSSGLMAGATLLLRTRPLLAGAVFGGLCFKPHFGLLIPVALLAGRQYRAFLGAAVSVAFLLGWSVLAYGTEPWRLFLAMALDGSGGAQRSLILAAGHVDIGGAVRLLGAPGWAITVTQIIAILVAAACVALVWRRSANRPRPEAAYAALTAGALVAAPFALFYDLMMASVAAAWLIRAARRDGFLPYEKTALAFCIVADLMSFPVALRTPVALGALVAPVLLALAVRRALRPGHLAS